ncbi:MAG: cation:proton antiporter [Epsilonproteobacteria bacterium]|nr:cation:proton antiporter [Campylobacterota bacterium]
MVSEISIIVTISVIIFISPYLSKILNIPTTPLEIVLGSLAGYFGFVGYNHLFELIAEVGFFYLMFLAGTEVNLRVFQKEDKYTMKMGTLYIVLLYLLSFLVSISLGFSHIFIVMLPLISVGLLVTLYKEFSKDTKWLNLAMTIGVLGELISIIALTVTGASLEHGIGIELYKSLGLLVIFLLGIVFIFEFLRVLFWWYPKLKIYLIPVDADKDEKDIRLSMALFFLMIAVMLVLELEIAFGAFIAGMFIATFFEHNKELPHKLSTFGFGFLVPIFFVYIGSTFELSSLSRDGLVFQALLITGSMIFIRVVASMALRGLLNAKEWIYFALSHSMPLTLLIAVATLAYHNRSIDQFHYYAFILASLFEVIIVMVGIKALHLFDHTSVKKTK